MRRRSAADGGVPEHLLSLPKWNEEHRSPDPDSARIEWQRARRQWVRQSGGSIDAVNALYGDGYDPGPDEDPRRAAEHERRTVVALAAPRARREAQAEP